MTDAVEYVPPSAAVYRAIAAVTGKLAKEGIAKNRKNEQQGYKFRGIDDVYNALSTLLADNKLCILPRVLHRDVSERTTAKGGVLFYTVLDVEFDLVSGEDESKHTVRVIGEAMDSGDKSTNKAMSAAYKYACMQVFCIPTEGDNDADNKTHIGIQPKIHSPMGDLGKDVPLEEAIAFADLIRELKEPDEAYRLWKDAQGSDVYFGAWRQLKSNERAKFKELVDAGKPKEQA